MKIDKSEADLIDLRLVFVKIWNQRIWLALGLGVGLFFAFLGIRYTTPSYQIEASVLVRDPNDRLPQGAEALLKLTMLSGQKKSGE